MMATNRTISVAFCLSTIVFILAVFHQWGSISSGALQEKTIVQPGHNGTLSDDQSKLPSFEQIALKYGTDKVTTHKYQFMYEKYLSGIRHDALKLLEIGLGCNMDYGPGASYYTWLEYLPQVNLYFIEYDAQCAKKYQEKVANAHVFVGDQADKVFLSKFASEATSDGLFDFIIDDGGHTMDQQIISLESLWEFLKPGGLYVIEDLQTSYWESFGGDASGKNVAKQTTMKYLYQMLDDLMIGKNARKVSHDVLSIDCMAEICALQKKKNSYH